jgi:hypothetical protein
MFVQNFIKNNKQVIGLLTAVVVVVGIVWFIVQVAKPQEMFREYIEEEVPVESAVEEEVEEEPEFEPALAPGAPEAVAPEGEKSGDITPEDLLPKNEAAADFDNQFPTGDGDLSSKNFLTAGFHVGINTVSSSLRNPSLQLRSDPYIPPKQVSPFLQSTILPDNNRKVFEIGGCNDA